MMYLRVRCFACPAFLLYNVGTGNFRGRKDTRTPLLAYMANNGTFVLLVPPPPPTHLSLFGTSGHDRRAILLLIVLRSGISLMGTLTAILPFENQQCCDVAAGASPRLAARLMTSAAFDSSNHRQRRSACLTDQLGDGRMPWMRRAVSPFPVGSDCGMRAPSRKHATRAEANALLRLQELLFVFGMKWGVVGAALAPAIGQYVGLAVMVGLLIREKALFAKDLASIPTLAECTPLLQVSTRCTPRAGTGTGNRWGGQGHASPRSTADSFAS